MNATYPTHIATNLVTVCICTFRRPEGVINAIKSIVEQKIPEGWQLEIVVVDNDRNSTLGDTIKRSFDQMQGSVINFNYVIETQSGVSFARNRCLLEARGTLIAFIDDDEHATPLWLVRMIAQLENSDTDAVFGPVLSEYATKPPCWLKDYPIQDCFRFPTGKMLGWGDTRTGNVLLRRSLLEKVNKFDNRFAKTGSEDTFFFYQAETQGAKYVWCDEAIVQEHVPLERMSRKWVLRRHFIGGRNFVLLQVCIYGSHAYVGWWMRGLITALTTFPVIVVLLLIGHPAYMRFACKMYGGVGKLAAPFYQGGDYAVHD